MTSFHSALVSCTKNTIVSLFKLLGWAFAEALGVSFDLHDSGLGSGLVRNTESRVVEHCGDLQDVIHGGTLSAKHAQRSGGYMQFAEAQMF